MTVRTLSALIALSLPVAAFAGAKKIPEYDLTDAATTLKSAKKLNFKTESKPKTYPKKVAIGFFSVRYHFKETQAGKDVTTVTTLKFTDDHYTRITDELNAQLRARLEAEGFEVVDQEAVVNSAAYKSFEEKDDVSENGKRVRYAPSGMKNLPTFSGGPKNAKDLAALNAELGTDAVVAAFVNIGICTVEPTKKTEMRSGVYACIKGDMTMPGLNVIFLGGAKGEGDKVKPEWTSRWFKAYEAYEYNKRDKLVYDTAIVSDWAAGRMAGGTFWKKAQLGAIESSFVGGASEVYNDGLALGFEMWESKMGKGREAAGLVRKDVVAPGELPFDEAAAVPQPKVEAPTLEGEIECFIGTSSIAGKPFGELLWRRGVTETKVVEDSVTLVEGQPPYRYITTNTIDGSSFKAAEVAGTWTGTGTFEPGWGSWTTELKMGNGMTVKATATVDEAGMKQVSQTLDGSGKVLAESTVDAKRVDQVACDARFNAL